MTDGYQVLVHPSNPDRPDKTWQENMYFSFFDPKVGVAGSLSVRQQLNKYATVWAGLATTTGVRWRRNLLTVPLAPEDHTPLRLGAANYAFTGGGEGMGIEIDDPDAELHLVIEEFYEPIYPWSAAGLATAVQVQDFHGHLEVAGRARGTARIGEQTFEIDALCYRDHSWGFGDMALIQSHCWVGGTFGPDLSFAALTFQGPNATYKRGGSIVRNGVTTYADAVDIVTWLESDGVSPRGVEVTFFLPQGDTLHVRNEAVDGWIYEMDGKARPYAGSFSACRTTIEGDDRTGFSLFELVTGQGYRSPIAHAFTAVYTDGISQREEHPGYQIVPAGVQMAGAAR
jgi:hypothetical protein